MCLVLFVVLFACAKVGNCSQALEMKMVLNFFNYFLVGVQQIEFVTIRAYRSRCLFVLLSTTNFTLKMVLNFLNYFLVGVQQIEFVTIRAYRSRCLFVLLSTTNFTLKIIFLIVNCKA